MSQNADAITIETYSARLQKALAARHVRCDAATAPRFGFRRGGRRRNKRARAGAALGRATRFTTPSTCWTGAAARTPLKSIIAKMFSLEKVAEAHKLLEKGGDAVHGKIVVKVA